jgi:hypothetical protein
MAAEQHRFEHLRGKRILDVLRQQGEFARQRTPWPGGDAAAVDQNLAGVRCTQPRQGVQ